MSLKPLPTEFCDHLSDLTGNELKVWMAYYLRTGDYSPTSHPGNGTLVENTGISLDTVKVCKKSLRNKGWLDYTDRTKQSQVMEVRLPWCANWSVILEEFATEQEPLSTVVQNPVTVVESTVVENFHPEGYRFKGLSVSSSPSGGGGGSCSAEEQKPPQPRGGNGKPNQNLKPEPTPFFKDQRLFVPTRVYFVAWSILHMLAVLHLPESTYGVER